MSPTGNDGASRSNAPVRALPLAWAVGLPLAIALLWRLPSLWLPPHGDHAWRDADGIGVARGFLHDSWNLFFPHVAERGGLSGICGMELPLVNWLSAALMAVFGDRYLVARLPVWLSIVPLALAMLALGRRLLGSEAAARVAAALVVLQPMVIFHSHKLMPEVPMLALVCLGATWAHDAFLRGSWRAAWLGSATLALATLLKPTFLGLAALLGFWFIQGLRAEQGRARLALIGRAVVIAGVPLASALLWFHHARVLDETFGLPLFKLHHDWAAAFRLMLQPRYLGFVLARELDNYFVWSLVAAAVIFWRTTLATLREHAALAIWLLASMLTVLLWGQQNEHHIYYAMPLAAPVALFGGSLLVQVGQRFRRPQLATAVLLGVHGIVCLFQSWHFFGRVNYDVPRLEAALAQFEPAPRSVVTDHATPVVALVTLRRTGWSEPAERLTPARLAELRAQGAEQLVESSLGGWLPESTRAVLPRPRYADDQLRIYDLRPFARAPAPR